MLTALNRTHEFAVHVRGAINNGVTEQEIQEVLLQTAVYCGVPAALESFRVAERRAEGDAAAAMAELGPARPIGFVGLGNMGDPDGPPGSLAAGLTGCAASTPRRAARGARRTWRHRGRHGVADAATAPTS